MIKFIYGNPTQEFTPEKQPQEMLVKDFEDLVATVNDQSKGELERFLKAFSSLGVSDEILDQMSKEQFIENAKLMRSMKYDDNLPPAEIEIGNRVYKANITEELNLSARDVVAIERVAKTSGKQFPSMVMAVIYKDVDLTSNEHYEDAHIKHKASIFRKEMSATYCIPLLVRISKDTIKDLADVEQAG